MMLTPTEQERLTIFTAAELARKHRALGIKLSHPEAVAYIADELLYGARLGRSLAELMGQGSTLCFFRDLGGALRVGVGRRFRARPAGLAGPF